MGWQRSVRGVRALGWALIATLLIGCSGPSRLYVRNQTDREAFVRVSWLYEGKSHSRFERVAAHATQDEPTIVFFRTLPVVKVQFLDAQGRPNSAETELPQPPKMARGTSLSERYFLDLTDRGAKLSDPSFFESEATQLKLRMAGLCLCPVFVVVGIGLAIGLVMSRRKARLEELG